MKWFKLMAITMMVSVMAVSCSGGGSDGGSAPADMVVDISEIPGIAVPVLNAVPDTTAIDTEQYSGTIVWSPADNLFKAETVYTASIELNPKSGFTMVGVPENFFTVVGAAATNEADSGKVTAVFQATGVAVEILSVEQTGGVSSITDSTGLTLTFDVDPTTISAEHITLVGATKGALTGSGTVRHIGISNITIANGSKVSVTVNNPAGYSIIGSPKMSVVYKGKDTYSADGVTFSMAFVPGNITFPINFIDSWTATVDSAFWIADTEVTYELWMKVYFWASNHGYYFQNHGRQGGDESAMAVDVGTNQHPVTWVSWRDCMIWCNALTEWYNSLKGTNYECVYVTELGHPIRDSRDINAAVCDSVVARAASKGFRLLTQNEWELAARIRNDSTNTVEGYSNPYFTKGNSASGAITYCEDVSGSPNYAGKLACDAVAVYYSFFNGTSSVSTGVLSTATVKSKGIEGANALCLYDMSGNVTEWCFDKNLSNRVHRGGGWFSGNYSLQIGYSVSIAPDIIFRDLGFRIAKTH